MFQFKDEPNMLWKALILLCCLVIVIESQISDEDDIPAQPKKVKKPKKTSTRVTVPNAEKLPKAIENADPTYKLKYAIGDHQFGEILAFERYSGVVWFGTNKSDAEIIERYPSSGEGLKVTAVDITAIQTTTAGSLELTRGGPGFRNVTVTLRATNTLFWTYNIKVYGKLF
ncbi:uncharacterized protein LOC115623106 [Scaptodrosophila lebanonensis]|uniref:Uncharacterized protein LOC115623106 n=1 Tax=Drosophila lebanonensis TaxID=7225 RepID=A0A6J2TDV0_DROLE|nr:uncharacterized protein LOC115623106 [Scaptodrosophila lebanonensis]